MNEDQELQELFQRVESKVSASRRLNDAVQRRLDSKRRSPMRLTIAGFATVAIATTLLFLMLPSSSSAGSLRRIGAAILDAKSMHVLAYTIAQGRPRTLTNETFYSDGAWRIVAFPGMALERIYIRKGGEKWLYLKCSDTAVGEPDTGSVPEGTPTALEFAKQMSDTGPVDTPREFKIEGRPDENGRPVYAVIGNRSENSYHLEMIVDKRTNLPIRATFAASGEDGAVGQSVVEEYRFDDLSDPNLFTPQIQSSTKILDLHAETEKLKELWRTPIKSVTVDGGHCDLRDLEVNRQGEVFMVCSYSGGKESDDATTAYQKSPMPAQLTDDLGRTYELVTTMAPGGTLGDTAAKEYLKFGDDRVEIIEWAPTTPSPDWKPAKTLNVTLSNSAGITRTDSWPLSGPIPTQFPAYSSAILMGYQHMRFEMTASILRAEGFEKEQDNGQAARWYRIAASQTEVPGWSRRYRAKADELDGKSGEPPAVP